MVNRAHVRCIVFLHTNRPDAPNNLDSRGNLGDLISPGLSTGACWFYSAGSISDAQARM
jgi:hypothetical protein